MSRFNAHSSAHSIRKRYVWTQMFLNTEKITSVFENTRLRVDSQIRFNNATCGYSLFLNTEEKISIFDNPRLRVDKAYSQVQNKRGGGGGEGDVYFFRDFCRPPAAYFDPLPFINFSNFMRDYKEVHEYIYKKYRC